MKHLDAAAPFPASGSGDALYVKLSWDTKTFRVVDSAVVNPRRPDASPGRRRNPSLPPSSPSPPPAAAPAPQGPARRALPTPDLTVMRRAATLKVPCSKATMSAGRADPSEAESLHSATKLSASKCLSGRRREAAARTPGIRKRLELSGESPGPDRKWTPEDTLSQLLDEELESDATFATVLSCSPPQATPLKHRLTPLIKVHKLRLDAALPKESSSPDNPPR